MKIGLPVKRVKTKLLSFRECVIIELPDGVESEACMAKMSRMAANTIKRQEVYDEVFRMLEERGEEMLKTSDNTNMCFPAVNALGEEIYVKITVSIPKADYDGHNEAASYEIDAREKRERKEEQAKERERKSAEQQR